MDLKEYQEIVEYLNNGEKQNSEYIKQLKNLNKEYLSFLEELFSPFIEVLGNTFKTSIKPTTFYIKNKSNDNTIALIEFILDRPNLVFTNINMSIVNSLKMDSFSLQQLVSLGILANFLIENEENILGALNSYFSPFSKKVKKFKTKLETNYTKLTSKGDYLKSNIISSFYTKALREEGLNFSDIQNPSAICDFEDILGLSPILDVIKIKIIDNKDSFIILKVFDKNKKVWDLKLSHKNFTKDIKEEVFMNFKLDKSKENFSYLFSDE